MLEYRVDSRAPGFREDQFPVSGDLDLLPVPDRRVIDRAGKPDKPLLLGDGTSEGESARFLPDMLRRVWRDPYSIAGRGREIERLG